MYVTCCLTSLLCLRSLNPRNRFRHVKNVINWVDDDDDDDDDDDEAVVAFLGESIAISLYCYMLSP